jgi:hypothetical protein
MELSKEEWRRELWKAELWTEREEVVALPSRPFPQPVWDYNTDQRITI